MIYNKNNLVISDIASKTEIRPEITGILFKKDRTVATDSYALIEVKNPKNFIDAKNIPILPAKQKPLTNFSKKGYILPAKSVKKMLSNLTDNNELPELDNTCWFLNTNDPAVSSVVSTDLEQNNTTTTKNLEGNYPDYDKIIPKKEGKSIEVSLDILKNMINTLAKMSIKYPSSLKITVYDNQTPVKITTKTDKEQDITALIMPITQE